MTFHHVKCRSILLLRSNGHELRSLSTNCGTFRTGNILIFMNTTGPLLRKVDVTLRNTSQVEKS